MNERVYLQYEFMQLGIDQYLEKLKNTQSEELRVCPIILIYFLLYANLIIVLQVQISAYLDNVFDVAALMDDSEMKNTALERVSDLEVRI